MLCSYYICLWTRFCLVSGYRNVLYINPRFEELVDIIKAGVPIDEVLTFRDIPLFE